MAATGISPRSSLLPLRTPSPGGVAHRPTSLTQPSATQSQQSTRKHRQGFPRRFSCHRIISRDDFGASFTPRLAQLSPEQPGILPLEFNTGDSVQEMRTWNFSGTDTNSTLAGQGVHAFLSTTQANRFRDNPDIWQRSYGSTHRGSVQNGGERAFSAQFRVFICMHQG
jgi:hypothetical protein